MHANLPNVMDSNSISSDSRFCSNWESRTEPRTRWILPSFYNYLEEKKDTIPGMPANTEENPQLIAARQALKQARKFLKATIKEKP